MNNRQSTYSRQAPVIEQTAVKRRSKTSFARDPVRDGLVVVSMTLVALALGIGLHLHFALAFWLAVVAALAVYVALLSTHVLIRRSEYIDDLRQQVAALERRPDRSMSPAGPGAAPAGSEKSLPVRADAPTEPNLPAADRQAIAKMTDYWRLAPATIGPVGPPSDGRLEPELPTSSNGGGSKSAAGGEAEQIDAVIKKIAADITQGQAALERKSESVRRPPVDGLPSDVDDSVAALRAAADVMREAGRRQPTEGGSTDDIRANAAPPPIPRSRPNDPARTRLAAIADAVSSERFDVMLEPILDLKMGRARHYVVSVRLRDGLADGVERMIAGTGLLPLLDAAKVESAARVAWRMEDRSKSGALFSQLAGESLVDDRFLNRFADTYRQGDTLSGRMVLSFKQAELRTFSDLQWSTLRDMADLGFRFCLDDITTLDTDFATMAASGFTFVRLDADVFLGGLPVGEQVIPAADICRHFSELGLAAVVAGIGDEDVAQQLQAYGVELGHGGLYGAARPVKADVLRNPHAAVA